MESHRCLGGLKNYPVGRLVGAVDFHPIQELPIQIPDFVGEVVPENTDPVEKVLDGRCCLPFCQLDNHWDLFPSQEGIH